MKFLKSIDNWVRSKPYHRRVQISLFIGVLAFVHALFFATRIMIDDLAFATKWSATAVIAIFFLLLFFGVSFYWTRQVKNVYKIGRQVIYHAHPDLNSSLRYGTIIAAIKNEIYIKRIDGGTDMILGSQIKRRAEKDEWESANITNG